MRKREQAWQRGRGEEGVFPHGDPPGSGLLKTALYFTKSFVNIDLYKNKETSKHEEVNQFIQILCKFRSQGLQQWENNFRLVNPYYSALHGFLRAKKAWEKWKSGTLTLITYLS